MSYGLFEDIQAFDEGRRTAARTVVAVAHKRVADQFGAFVAAGGNLAGRTARLNLVSDQLRQVVADVVEEHAPDTDIDALEETIIEHLKGDGVTDINGELEDAPTAVGSGTLSSKQACCGNCSGDCDCDEDGCSCDRTSSTKTADAVSDAGGAVETVDLPTANDAGDLGGPSPETDHTTWKPNALNDSGNLKPIDTDMDGTPKPTVKQEVGDEPSWDGDFLDQTDAVTETQDLPSADASGESTERNIDQPSQAADQWTGTEGQADPVGGGVFASTRKSIAQDDYLATPEAPGGGAIEPMTQDHAQELGVCHSPDGKTIINDKGEVVGVLHPEGGVYGPGNTPLEGGPRLDGERQSPVPYGTRAAVDPEKNPIRDILEGGEMTDLQIEAAIAEYEKTAASECCGSGTCPDCPAK